MPVSDILISPYRACPVISKARRRPRQVGAFCTGPGCDTDGQQKCNWAGVCAFLQTRAYYAAWRGAAQGAPTACRPGTAGGEDQGLGQVAGEQARALRRARPDVRALSGPGRESVAPVQPDEPGQGERVPPLQPGCGTLEQHHLLTPARSDWLYQAAADPELGCQRRGDLREGGRDQDGIVGATLGQSAAAVASEHLRIADARPGQVPPRLVSQVWPA